MKRDLALAVAVPAGLSDAWRRALPPLALALFAVVALFFPTAREIVDTWARTETYAHGFVVVPIVLWLVYRMRGRLAALAPRPSWATLPFFALAGFAWLLGRFGAVNALSQAAFVAMIVLCVPAVLGVGVARAMAFPLGFMFFAVPIGDFLLPTLMDRTADFTIAALRASGVPVYREGLHFVIPSGRWSVIEACSGVRYLIASLMTGTLFAYLQYRSYRRRVAFIGVAIVVPIVANWIRAYLIVMLAHVTNNVLATQADHLVYGWIFFGIVMLLMFWIGTRWPERAATAAPRPLAVPAPRAPPAAAPWIAGAAVVAIVAAWPALEQASAARADAPPVALATPAIAQWTPGGAALPFAPQFKAPSALAVDVLRNGDDAVGLYIAYYRVQDARRKLVSSENVLVQSEGSPWVRIRSASRAVRLGTAPAEVVATELRGPRGERIDAWKWYWIDGDVTANDAVAKARIAWERLRGRGDDGAAIVVYAMSADGTDASARVARFARDAWPAIDAMLAKTQAAAR